MGIPPITSMEAPIARACTKLARHVWSYATLLFGDTFPDAPYGLALGMYAFDRTPPWPGHKLNVAIVRCPDPVPVFYEGYVGVKSLTEENLRLCRHYVF